MVVKRKIAEQLAEHFTRFTTNYCLKHSKKTTRRTTSAIWSIFADLNSPLSSKHPLPRVLAINALLHPLADALAATFSAVAFYCNDDAKPPPRQILREFDVSRIGPRLGGLPHFETFTWQSFTPAERVTRSGRRTNRPGWSPHLSCKLDQIKMRD